MTRHVYSPTKFTVAKVRADLKALGIKANVRRCTHSIRVVLPNYGDNPSVADDMRDYMVEANFSFADGTSATRADWRHGWSHFEGRAQFFLYDIR